MPPIEETASFIRRVLDGEQIYYDDGKINDKVKVHSSPKIPTLLFFETGSPEEAEMSSKWAYGLIVDADDTNDAYKAIDKFKSNGGANKSFSIRLTFSYGDNPDTAIETSELYADDFIQPQKAGDEIPPEEKKESRGKFKVLTSIADLLQWIEPFKKLEASRIILRNVSKDQDVFINAFGQFHESYKALAVVD